MEHAVHSYNHASDNGTIEIGYKHMASYQNHLK